MCGVVVQVFDIFLRFRIQLPKFDLRGSTGGWL
jgi:hypothetical protein